MSSVSRLFGTSGTAVRNRGTTSAIIYKGTIDDATVVTLTLEPGSIYYLFTAEYNATSFAFRGCRSVMIKAPEDDLFGTVAVAHGADYSSQNSGVTIGYPDDSTVTIARKHRQPFKPCQRSGNCKGPGTNLCQSSSSSSLGCGISRNSGRRSSRTLSVH